MTRFRIQAHGRVARSRNHVRVLTLAASVLALVPAAAHANTFSYSPCSAPQRSFYPAVIPGLEFVGASEGECHGSDTAALFNGESAGPSGAGVRFFVPSSMPNTTIASVYAGMLDLVKPQGSAGTMYAVDQTHNGSYLISSWGSSGASNDVLSDKTQFFVAGTKSVFYRAACDTTCTFDRSSRPYLKGDLLMISTVTYDDSTAPALATFKRTSLLAPDATIKPGDTATISFTASDQDSGVKNAQVYSGNTLIADMNTGSDCNALSLPACPQSRDATLAIDTTKLPLGQQTLSIQTTDYAGNVGFTTTPSFTIAAPVDPSTPAAASTAKSAPVAPILTPGPTVDTRPLNGGGAASFTVSIASPSTAAKGEVTSKVAQATKTTRVRTAAYGKQVQLTGTVAGPNGQPIVGAFVDVVRRVAAVGATAARIATISTDAHGTFTYTFTATGSANYRFDVPRHVGGDDYVGESSADVAVKPGLSLHGTTKTARHAKTKLTGKLKLDPIPAGGAHIEIQYQAKSGWEDIDVVRSSAAGAFTWTHRFGLPGTFHFRARLLSTVDLAGLATTSGTITVQVR